MITVRIQESDFCPDEEKYLLQGISTEVGAIVEFTGCVRADSAQGRGILQGIFLEHYPGMTEDAIRQIIGQACSRWPLLGVTVIHRVGHLGIGENIVYVGVASSHRRPAIECVGFIMDYLKNDVPIWKKAVFAGSDEWIEQKKTDVDAKKAWFTHDDS